MSFKIPLIACVMGVLIGGSAVAHHANAAEILLTARPGLCLVEKIDDKPCVMSVLLDWRAVLRADYCLYQSVQDEQPIQCWESSEQGQLRHNLSSRDNVTYWLQLAGSERRLAPITVRIVGVQQRNPLRRRRRHPWSLL